jgi:hypothetical protein
MSALRKLVIASKISKRMPEYPCSSVLIRTSIAALVAEDGSVQPDSLLVPKIPALRNLKEIWAKKIISNRINYSEPIGLIDD